MQQDPKVRRILAIDGGGLKGALPTALLAEFEKLSGERIVEQFDLIAGTSTGAARRAFEIAAKRLGEKSAAGGLKLGIGRGAMGATAAPASAMAVPKHQFYGRD